MKMGTGMTVLAYLLVTAVCIPAQGSLGEQSAGTSPFADLSMDELTSVKDYLYRQTVFNLGGGNKHVSSSVIFLIEAIPPPKALVLAYLDNAQPAPQRAARVVLHRGDLEVPVVQEFRVYPIPNPTDHEQIKNPNWRDPIPFTSHSFLGLPDIIDINTVIEAEVSKINNVLEEITGGFKMADGCTYNCLDWLPGFPGHTKPNQRKIAPFLSLRLEGNYLHPIGVQFVLNIEGTDTSKWQVEHVWFQGRTFRNFEEVMEARKTGVLHNQTIPLPDGIFTEKQRSSMNFRGEPRPTESKRGPRSVMPDGKRYGVSDRHIKWMGWEFEFSMLTSSGIQLHNVKFLKERIAYELSLQEVGVLYSGGSPTPSHTSYYDSFALLGTRVSELFTGVDCPHNADYFDFVHFFQDKPYIFKNSACVFELNRGVPLRRHYQSNHEGGYFFTQGMPDNVLVFRQIVSVGNYDYVVDFMFHQAGQIEGKVSLTGYLLSTFYAGPEMNKYGNVVNEPTTLGSIHHHIINIKADLDIKGQSNRFKTMDIKLEEVQDDLDKDETLLNRYFVDSLKQTEMQAAYKFNFDTPKYLVMYNEAEKNRFGHSRGYRILSDGMTKVLLPKTYRGFKSRTWAEYQVAVTKQKDHEQSSSSIYASMEPYDPVMSFEDYIKDDENIVDQDLVAWITLGTHHIPHSEDVPIVTTPGVQLSFFLLPYNYFDEDPSLASRDNIRITPGPRGNEYHYAGVTPDHDVNDFSCTVRVGASVSVKSSAISFLIVLLVSVYQVLLSSL